MANTNIFLKIVKQRLSDFFIQERDTFFESSSKCLLYKYLPDTFSLQFYSRKNIPENLLVLLTKYRLSSHMHLVEQGRYNGTVRSMHICKYCNLGEVEDEFHFILICPFYKSLRVLYLKKILLVSTFNV